MVGFNIRPRKTRHRTPVTVGSGVAGFSDIQFLNKEVGMAVGVTNINGWQCLFGTTHDGGITWAYQSLKTVDLSPRSHASAFSPGRLPGQWVASQSTQPSTEEPLGISLILSQPPRYSPTSQWSRVLESCRRGWAPCREAEISEPRGKGKVPPRGRESIPLRSGIR